MTKMNVLGRKTGRDDRQQVGAVNRDMRCTEELFAQRIKRRALQCAPILPASLVGEQGADTLAVEASSEAQTPQEAHCIWPHIDPAADLSQLGSLLINLDFKAGLS